MLSTCILTGAMEDSPPKYRQDHRSSTTVRYQGKKGLNRLFFFLDTVVVYEGKVFFATISVISVVILRPMLLVND